MTEKESDDHTFYYLTWLKNQNEFYFNFNENEYIFPFLGINDLDGQKKQMLEFFSTEKNKNNYFKIKNDIFIFYFFFTREEAQRFLKKYMIDKL